MHLRSGRRRGPADVLLALVPRERDQRAIRAAVPAGATPHFVARAGELRQGWVEVEPTAVLVEVVDAEGASPARALAAIHRRVPTIPVCAYIPPRSDAVREAVRLAAIGLVGDVITAGSDDLRVRLRELMDHAHARGEAAAVRRVWRPWTTSGVRDVVAACIAASDGMASVNDIARRLNRSPRTLERQVVRAGLPPPHRVLRWCRLLRAAYRLEQPGASVKHIAEALGYPSPHALAQRLRRHTGLTLTGLRTGGFDGLAAYVHTRLLAARTRANRRARRGARHRG